MDYFKRAQGYEDTADKLEAMGCLQSAKRAREKAAYWDKRGTERLHMLEDCVGIGGVSGAAGKRYLMRCR